MNWHVLLDLATGAIVVGLLLALAYEIVALISKHIPFTGNLPTITGIVRPWIYAHEPLAIALAVVAVAAIGYMIYHFFISKGTF